MGTLLNVITVALGCILGLLLRKRFSDSLKLLMLQGIGLITVLIGIQMGLKTSNILIPLGGLILGGIAGYLMRVDYGLNRIANKVSKRFNKDNQASTFTEGLITASLIFCVGPMTILGSINDGLYGDYQLLAIKSVLDGFTAIALTASLGIGVAFSIITIIIIQGGLTLLSYYLSGIFTDAVITETTAVGGIIIIGLGLMILDIKKIEVANFLPAIILTPVIVYIITLVT
jgi:uncharacterized membrane protein YqgA involved in biofilm formation